MSNLGGRLKTLIVGEAYTVYLPKSNADRRGIKLTGTVIDEMPRFYVLKDCRGRTTTVLKNDLHREAVKIEKNLAGQESKRDQSLTTISIAREVLNVSRC